MTCTSCIIIGDGPIIEEVNTRLGLVAAFRVAPFKAIYAKYERDESSITASEAQFVLRCAADVIDNKDFP
jgi:hypothetical protein